MICSVLHGEHSNTVCGLCVCVEQELTALLKVVREVFMKQSSDQVLKALANALRHLSTDHALKQEGLSLPNASSFIPRIF